MDFHFIFDQRSKRHTIELEGEHVVLSSYLNDELGAQGMSQKTLHEFKSCLTANKVRVGREWSLSCHDGEILIYHNSVAQYVTDENGTVAINQESSEYEDSDGLGLSLAEQVVQCGLDDLIYLIDKWLEFIDA